MMEARKALGEKMQVGSPKITKVVMQVAQNGRIEPSHLHVIFVGQERVRQSASSPLAPSLSCESCLQLRLPTTPASVPSSPIRATVPLAISIPPISSPPTTAKTTPETRQSLPLKTSLSLQSRVAHNSISVYKRGGTSARHLDNDSGLVTLLTAKKS